MTNFRLQLERTYSELPDIFFTKLFPTPVSNPELVIFNEKLANETGLHFSGMTEGDKINFLSGNLVPEELNPLPKPMLAINLETLPFWAMDEPSSWVNTLLHQGNALTFN